MNFVVTDEQYAKAFQWYEGIKKRDKRDLFSYGAMGGGLSFRFCLTNLGVIVSAEEALSGESLNLTDFSDF